MIRNKSSYLTSAEVANELGFSHDYVRKLINRGKIKADKIGRNWFVHKRDIIKIHRKRFPRDKEAIKDGNDE